MLLGIAEKRHGQPVWIVFTGTSVDRGSFHALVDHVAAVGMLEGGAMNRSVADALFENVEDRRGRGSTTKCWGWIDVQIGSIRLSYQDARLHIHADKPRWINAAKRRWDELLSEGPDLVIFGVETNDNGPDETMRLYNRVTSQIVEAAATTQFRGLVAINPTKARIKNGGIKTAYEYMSGEPRSSVDNIRRSLDNAFDQCKSCEGIARENIIIPDELIMGWSFLFDMERPMSDMLASQHFHRYATKAVPQSGCGSRYTNKRYVIGAVVEMASQIYLGVVLSHIRGEMGISEPEESSLIRCSTDQNADGDAWEVSLASRHPFRSCFTCPLSVLPWKPPLSPESTLSDIPLKNIVENFDEIGRGFAFAFGNRNDDANPNAAFCYDHDPKPINSDRR